MSRILVALVVGLLLGAGLTVSRMINPAKVLAFLDFAGIASGDWDPSLALVMAGALAVTAAGYRMAPRREHPVCAKKFSLPTRRDIDWRLLTGAALFGVGWGLVGYCPGPAIAGLALGIDKTVVFVISMLAGMALFHILFEKWPSRGQEEGLNTGAGTKSFGGMSRR